MPSLNPIGTIRYELVECFGGPQDGLVVNTEQVELHHVRVGAEPEVAFCVGETRYLLAGRRKRDGRLLAVWHPLEGELA